jgi:hypothetical protein
MACTVATFQNLTLCPDWSVGLGKALYLGFPADFTAVPTPPLLTSAITNEEYATAVGTFTAVALKGFVKMELDITQKLEINSKISENGAVMTSIKGRIVFSKDALGFIKKLQPRTSMVVVVDKPHGVRLQMGYTGFETVVKSWDIKEGVDMSYADFEFENIVPPLVYTGVAIPMQP